TEEIPRWAYLFTQFRVIVTYIRLLSLPLNQNLDYDYPVYNSFFEPQVLLSFLVLLSIFVLVAYLFYRSRCTIHASRFTIHDTRITHHVSRLIAFGIVWFFLTLSVESSIIPIRDVIFEHRLYLPSIGFIIAFSIILFYYTSRIAHHVLRVTRYGFPLLLTTVVIVLSVAAYQRNTVWKNNITLWEDVVKKTPYKARPYNELGLAYMDKGNPLEAISYFEKALAIKSDLALVHSNIGNAFDELNYTDLAIIEYKKAIEINPDFETAHYNLGRAYYKKKMFEEASEEFKIAISLNPFNHDAKQNLKLSENILK
ncbi:MAG: tetratricopeptide repeat protein, partial [Nitrospirae bacterium]|nr:tetratricopeptide repeat protein [Nitrospirota bacterium]